MGILVGEVYKSGLSGYLYEVVDIDEFHRVHVKDEDGQVVRIPMNGVSMLISECYWSLIRRNK